MRLKIALLYGGTSAEREIALKTGAMIAKNLDPKKYEVELVDVDKDGNWIKILANKRDYFDLAFIALHGPMGEDGIIQGFLEALSIPYTGSGVLASALGMNKYCSRRIFQDRKLIVPQFIAIKKPEYQKSKSAVFGWVLNEMDIPCVVKPNNQGSSIGITIVKSRLTLEEGINLAFTYDDLILVEEYLDGLEVTASILGNSSQPETLIALPLIEIIPRQEYGYFSYEAKYIPDASEEIVPARLDQNITRRIQRDALTAYQTLDCKGFGRVDMILMGEKPYILELNTIPGMTKTSLVPKAAKAYGLDFPGLLNRIIELALT